MHITDQAYLYHGVSLQGCMLPSPRHTPPSSIRLTPLPAFSYPLTQPEQSLHDDDEQYTWLEADASMSWAMNDHRWKGEGPSKLYSGSIHAVYGLVQHRLLR